MGDKVYRVHYMTPDHAIHGFLADLVDGREAVRLCRLLHNCYGLHAWFRREDAPRMGRLTTFLNRIRLRDWGGYAES